MHSEKNNGSTDADSVKTKYGFNDLFNALRSSVALLDENGVIKQVNEGWKKFADGNGLCLSNYAVGANYLSLSDTNDDPALAPRGLSASIRDVLHGKSEQLEYDYPCHSPTELRWFRLLVRPLRSGGNSDVVAIHMDVTAQKLAELSLRRQADTLDLIQDAILLVDLDHRITYANRAASEIYGWPIHEMIGQKTTDIFATEPLSVLDQRRDDMRMRHGWSGQITHKKRNGQTIALNARWRFIQDDKGTESILKVHTDLSMLSQLIRTQRMQTIGQMAGGIAHDLNNILTPMLLAAQAVSKSRTEPKPELGEKLVFLTERARDLIKQLLGFARGFESEQKRESIGELLKELDKILKFSLPSTVSAEITTSGDKSLALINKTQIHQVLMNLCLNASDAMDRKGTIQIKSSVEQIENKRTRFGDLLSGHYFVIRVSDTGVGMSPTQIERSFEPFYTTKEFGRGTGLGLSTCVGILKGHNGFIDVKSQLGSGSTFTVYLPVEPIKEPPKADRADQSLLTNEATILLLAAETPEFREVASRTSKEVCLTADPDDAIATLIGSDLPLQAIVIDSKIIENQADPDVYWEALAQFHTEGKIVVYCGKPLSPARLAKIKSLNAEIKNVSLTADNLRLVLLGTY